MKEGRDHERRENEGRKRSGEKESEGRKGRREENWGGEERRGEREVSKISMVLRGVVKSEGENIQVP